MQLYLFAAAIAVWTNACTGPRPLRGGRALTTARSGAVAQSLIQGDNPAQSSRQHQETIRLKNYTIPAGAHIEETRVEMVGAGLPVTHSQAIVLGAPMPVIEREETRSAAELGAAQKDTARELGAKLSSLRGVTWLGVALFVFGLTSLVWPPLKLVIGSITTSAAILVGGLALMILPTLIAGNELLILGGVALTAGAWFLAHRHGRLRGQLSAAGAPANEAAAVVPASTMKN